MTRLVKADENGSIQLPREWLGANPHDLYVVEAEGGQVVVKPVNGGGPRSKWQDMTPQQRLEDFRHWVAQQEPSEVHLTNEQLRRENMYD